MTKSINYGFKGPLQIQCKTKLKSPFVMEDIKNGGFLRGLGVVGVESFSHLLPFVDTTYPEHG